ncbi:MAG: PAS domain S-box protein [Desulfarculaceae bacterium]|nr:PAS domain S-box protein [Desulfarculaceae bacterium]
MKQPPSKTASRLWQALRRALSPPPVHPDGGSAQWRERILYFLLGPGLALGILAFLIALPFFLRQGHYYVVFMDCLVAIGTATIFLARRLPYWLRSGAVLTLAYGLGTVLLLKMGPVSGGALWLFVVPIMAGILLGIRAAMACLLLNCLALGLISLVAYNGLLPWAGMVPYGLERWPVIALSFMLLNAVTTVPTAMLVDSLQKAVEHQREISHELEKGRVQLAQEVAVRRRAQKALTESEKLYRLVTENVSDAIWVLDLATLRLSYVSPSAQHTLGYSPEEMRGLKLEQLLAPDSLRLAMDTLGEELAQDDGPVPRHRSRLLELQHLCKDGSYIWAEVPVRFMRDENGKPAGVLGVSRDITARKLAQEALERSERRYRDLFDSISDIIYTQDLEGRFLSVNRATAELFGYAPEELVGKKGSDFMLPEHRRSFEERYLTKMIQDGEMAGTSQYLDSHGERRYIEYRSALVRPEDGEPYISGMGRDVTERIQARREVRQLQTQLLQSQKMEAVGTLAGGIAHDFNNILAVMIGYTELVLDDMENDSRHRPQLEQVVRAGERATNLVRQILTFSRVKDGNRNSLVLQDLVAEELELLRPSLPGRIELETELEAPGAAVMADATQVRQVLLNLVTNASQAMEQNGGKLTVGLRRVSMSAVRAAVEGGLEPGEYLRLEVRDTGPGMSPQVCRRVFEPFFTTKEVDQGSGLGLAVVHGILKAHHGAVTARSQPGKGAAFTVYLPSFSPEGQAPQAEAPAQQSQPGGGESILLVDDVPQLLAVASLRLSRLGYRVKTAGSGEEALSVFSAAPQNFDLLMTDLTMPGISGEELARRVGGIAPELPVIIVTGYGHELDTRNAPPNVKQVIGKPASLDELAQVVRTALDLGQ